MIFLEVYIGIMLFTGFISTVVMYKKLSRMKWYGLIFFYVIQPLLIIREIVFYRRKG